MDKLNKGWFTEIDDQLNPGLSLSLRIKEVLYEGKSDYQDILVVNTSNHGKALILDGIIQCTEFDEFSYQEMISFLPLFAHPNPSKVLIVGGGDGGVAREVQKHPKVKEFVQVEIDEKVINICKKYLPSMAKGFDSSKLTLKVCDGFEYMRNHKHEFDVIITDSSDPIGPAVNLFTESYFKMLKEALKPGGVICSQGGCAWLGLDAVKQTIDHCKKHFNNVRFAYASVPTYPSGQISFIVASLDDENSLDVPKLVLNDKDLTEMELKYYNSEIHKCAFVLPNFIKRGIA